MKLVESLKDLLTAAREGAGRVHAADKRVRGELDTLDGEERTLRSAPPPAETVEASIRGLVEATGAAWRDEHGARLRQALGGGIETDLHAGTDRLRPASWPDSQTAAIMGVSPLTLGALCGLMPSMLIEGLGRALPTDGGPPLPRRLERLEEIRRRRAELERDHAELVAAAAEAGITLAELPANRARRVQAEAKHEAWALDQRANAALYRKNPKASPAEPAKE